MKKILAAIRANDWWEYKIPPMLSVVYIIIQNSHYTFLSLLPSMMIAVSAIILCAIYVSLLNDATDMEDDAKAGKRNGMANYSRVQQTIFISLPLLVALCIIGYFVKFLSLASLFYFAAYVSFTLYSLPPFRLKKRGFMGIAADALGSQVFPTLFLAISFYQWTNQPIALLPLVFLTTWLFCFGLRGILWHQLADKENDKVSGLFTFVQKISDVQLSRLSIAIIILEMAAFATFIWLHALFLIIPGLILYFIYNWLLLKYCGIRQILITPKPVQYRIFMFEYYQVFLPLSLLILYACKDPINIIGLPLHFFLFRVNICGILRSIKRMFASLLLPFLSTVKK
ncbi:UbiA prenyltransferase family protein [Chitinophaga ginsengisoli]|uniref:UbiA prenyltransferase family protein n=1 Tax=Chitinophaga ginsengisoli TaxID=363837 RepID=A0A2P8FUJ1_9BACT|nr:UbiA family prenyltransferase [Chitinophaga ginsengisoli]PSL25394.1 UbiA prenyltransferase family protein [Chitinophaga ginsengisoli]